MGGFVGGGGGGLGSSSRRFLPHGQQASGRMLIDGGDQMIHKKSSLSEAFWRVQPVTIAGGDSHEGQETRKLHDEVHQRRTKARQGFRPAGKGTEKCMPSQQSRAQEVKKWPPGEKKAF